MTYDKTLNEIHAINLLGGVNVSKLCLVNRIGGNITTFPTDALGTDNLSLGDTGNDNLRSNQQQNSLLSYLGRINYSLYDKYLVTFSMRADGSSRFGENKQVWLLSFRSIGLEADRGRFRPRVFLMI